MRPQKHFPAISVILLLLCASYAESAVFNVSTAQDFRAALNTAQSNGEDDTINLSAGTYKTGGASFNYQPVEGKNLTIQAAAGASAAAVILDGEQKDRAFYVLIGNFVADLELKNITITDGKKTDAGGGLYIQLTTGAITISGCIIKDSYSNNSGGGAWLKSTAPYGLLSLTIDGTTVSGNSAYAGGGVVVDGNWDLTMTNTTISQNICPLYGGAGMYLSGGTKGTIESCTFSKNVCQSGSGGGFRLIGGPLAISKSTFTENSASYGGGFNMENSNVTVSDCLFTGNSTPSDYGGGGAIMSSGGYSLTVERSTMLSNSGYNGGAVFTNGCTTTLINNIIANNTAMINGGGLYLVHGYSTASILTHNTITNNEAKTNGDGLYFEMLDNRAKSDLYNTIIYNNGAEDIYIKGSATITAKNCTYKTIAGQSLTSFADTVDSDPLFVNASGNDFHLQDTSPCINKGTASAAQMPKTDFEGDARDSLPDIGADENKNVPAPGGTTTTTIITTTTVPGGTTTTTTVSGSSTSTTTISDSNNTGELGGPCFGNGTCNAGLVCNDSAICVEPPDAGEGEIDGPCYPNGTCNAGLTCNANNICEEGSSCGAAPGCDGCCISYMSPDSVYTTDVQAFFMLRVTGCRFSLMELLFSKVTFDGPGGTSVLKAPTVLVINDLAFGVMEINQSAKPGCYEITVQTPLKKAEGYSISVQ